MTPLDAATIFGNVITAALLAIAGIAALMMAGRAEGRPLDGRPLPAHLLYFIGGGLCLLAADEALDLHERAGRWLYDRGVEAPGPINHVDDLVILLYIAIAGVIGMSALPALVRARPLLAWMIAAGVMFVAAAALDALATPGSWLEAPEEALEACGAIVLAIVFAREALDARTRSADAHRPVQHLAAR